MPRILRVIEFLAGGPVFTRRVPCPRPARRRPASGAYPAWLGTARARDLVLDGIREEAGRLRVQTIGPPPAGSSEPVWVVAA